MTAPISVEDAVHKGLSTATMLSFTVPEVGPMISGLFVGMGAVFDLCLSFPKNTNPLARVPTEGDLQQAVNDIKAQVDLALITHDVQDVFDKFENYTKTLHASWSDTNTTHGITFVGAFATAAAEQAWVDDRSTALQGPLKYAPNGDLPPMLDRLQTIITTTPLHLQTASMFIYCVNIFVMFCKINMLWEYVLALRAHDIAQDLNDAATIAAAQAAIIWHKADPATRGPAPTLPPALTAMVDMTTFEAASGYIRVLKQELGGPDAWAQAAIQGKVAPDPDATGVLPDDAGSSLLLQYLMKIHAEVLGAFTAAETDMGNRDAQVTVVTALDQAIPPNTYYYVKDALNGYTSSNTLNIAVANAGRDAYSGTVCDGIWDAQITQKGYGIFTQAALDDIQSIISCWTQALVHANDFLNTYQDVKVPPIYPLGS